MSEEVKNYIENTDFNKYKLVVDREYKEQYIQGLEQENKQLKEVIEEVREYNNQIIKDTKDFYRPTEDKIYSGDTLIDLAETNIQILDKVKEVE